LRFCIIIAIVVAVASAAQRSDLAQATANGTFHLVASYQGLGALTSAIVASDATGSPRIYATYMYVEHTLDLVAIDPATGDAQSFENPAATEYGAIMLLGPDGNIYLGTRPHAHLLRFDPRNNAYTDLGRPAPSESYIWDLTVGSDRQIYGCTYPSARLFRFDPATGVSKDLGVMNPGEQYGRWIASSDDGFIYIGTGFRRAGVIAFEIATGEHRNILPPAFSANGEVAVVHRSVDGKAYASVGAQRFRLYRWTAVSIPESAMQPADARNRIDSRQFSNLASGTISIHDAVHQIDVSRPITYDGRAVDIFRLGLGPDGNIYAGTILPFHFVRVSPQTGQLTDLGVLGGGEPYSLVSDDSRLFIAAYSGLATLMVFDPSRPFAIGGAAQNPALFRYEGEDEGLRPQALVFGQDGAAYIGAVAGYGKLGGPLVRLDPSNGRVEIFGQLVKDESVVTLAVSGGSIIGGTTVIGGGGSSPTQSEAKLFVWDAAHRLKVFEVVPVPKAHEITDLIALKGIIYGIAGGTTLFGFDVAARRVTFTSPLPFKRPIYNSVSIGPDGNVWGLAEAGIFKIDPKTNSVRLVAKSPHPITAGFALVGNDIFFSSDNALYAYHINL